MRRILGVLLLALLATSCVSRPQSAHQEQDGYPGNYAQAPRFKTIVFYSKTAEYAHVQFGEQTVDFFKRLNDGDGFYLDIATDFSGYDYEKLKEYNTVVWVNTAPYSPEDRAAFEEYMKNGGGWIGFHAAAYNDVRTQWPWFNEFLGCGKFLCNNWPPQPALLDVETKDHPVTKNLPDSFIAPASEWYMWDQSPRLNENVEVLLSLSPKNYPLGIKDVISFGDFPVVWSNTKYRMIYLNMGHGDVEYLDAEQNLLFVNAFRWVVSRDPSGNPFLK